MPSIRIKICGVGSPADAVRIADLGADAIGLNFFQKSPRFVPADQASAIVRAIPPFLTHVGLFVGASAADVQGVAKWLGLRAVQTYPDRPTTDSYFPTAHIPAFRVKDASSLTFVNRFLSMAKECGSEPDAILLDAHVDGKMGGTGQVAPWELLQTFHPGVPILLAGGLNPDNVADAIRTVRPWGVDVASGVESAPGQKDFGRIRAFIQAARAAATELEEPEASGS